MIITDSTGGWDSKTNFTDKNDVFVGFDTDQCCCEDAGYFITTDETVVDTDTLDVGDSEGYTFDVDYFEEVVNAQLDCGGQVRFKLVHASKPTIYLNLYNYHNGYYGHGFEATIKG